MLPAETEGNDPLEAAGTPLAQVPVGTLPLLLHDLPAAAQDQIPLLEGDLDFVLLHPGKVMEYSVQIICVIGVIAAGKLWAKWNASRATGVACAVKGSSKAE